MKSTHTRNAPTLSGQFAWLAALAVVFFQLQIVLHPEVDHDPGQPGEASCDVCVKLEENGSAPLVASAATSLVPRADAKALFLAESPADRPVCRYAARAPPRI